MTHTAAHALTPAPATPAPSVLVQRSCSEADPGHEDAFQEWHTENLGRSSKPTDARTGNGRPLDPAALADRGRVRGHDFSRVRVEPRQASTGIPPELEAGLERLSGLDLSGIHVHRRSQQPRRYSALALTRGEDIYLGPGQERHLPHEAWHAVQQMQGRVSDRSSNHRATTDEAALEREADVMGAAAARLGSRLRQGGSPRTENDDAPGSTPQKDERPAAAPQGQANEAAPVQFKGGTAQLAFDITEKVLSTAGGGSDLTITVDEVNGFHHSSGQKTSGSKGKVERKAEQFNFLVESVLFRQDLIRVKTIMDYEVDDYGVGNVSFALVEAHDAAAGWGGRFEFNLTPRDDSGFGAFTLTVSFDVSGWVGGGSGSFTYRVSPFGVFLMRSSGDVGGYTGMNQDHFGASPS